MLKSLFSYAVALSLLFAPAAAQAAIHTDEEHIARLTELHAQADRYLEKDKCNEALVIYDEIILEEPDDEVAYTNSGYCYMLLGKFEKAEDAFKNAMMINPDNKVAEMGIRKIHDPDGDWKVSDAEPDDSSG
jgi:tetratricopeptide (TPR) repeat protein